MSITVTGKQMEIGESLRDFVTTETQTIITRYALEIHEVNVTLAKDTHNYFKVDVSLNLGRGLLVHAVGADHDAYKAVSESLEKLETQVRRYKTRIRDRNRDTDHESRTERVQKYILKTQEEDTHEDNPLIIAETTSEIRTLSVGDAVMRMDLSQSPVFIFKNAANGELNVVFKRNDGNIGWVDPSLKM